jgi:hypothetical protein
MLHTLPQHRRKGLARLTLLSLLHKLQSQAEQAESSIGAINEQPLPQQLCQHNVDCQCHECRSHNPTSSCDVYCYVVKDNTASIACLQAIGLVNTGEFIWMAYQKVMTN